MPRLHARIHGLVQGVGFRHFTWKRAQRLGLQGWVRNRRDGTVEVMAQGPRPALEALLEALHQGPLGSRVDRVDVTWMEEEDASLPAAFEVWPTV